MLTIQGRKYRITPRGKWVIGVLGVILLGFIALGVGSTFTPDVQDSPKSALQSDNTVKHPATQNATKQTNEQAGVVPTEFSIFFDPDGYALRDEYQEQLNLVVEYLKTHPEYQLHLAGNYNGFPNLEGVYFEKLSVERAESVKSYFIFKGIEERRITISNNGASKPMNEDNTKIELSKNRRVDVTVIN